MARVKRGVIAGARHKKILKKAKGYYNARRKVFRAAKQAVIKAGQYAYRDRKTNKRTMRALWITRINAAARVHGLSYSKLIPGLNLAGLSIDRKVLADIAMNDEAAFGVIAQKAKDSLLKQAAKMQSLVEAARAEIARAANIEELEQIRVRLLGKKGEITAQLKSLGSMDHEARKAAGAQINEAKEALTTALDARRAELENEQLAAQLASDTVDVTLPGRGQTVGGLHPVTRARRRIEQIFRGGGFTVADGPEIEDHWHNFEALNIPADHPARAMHDTFYFGDG